MQSDAIELGADEIPKRRGRARLRTLEHLDGRTRASKRAHELTAIFEAALGGELSPSQRLAVQRAAMLSAIAEDAAARQLAGEAIDLDQVTRAGNAARRAVLDLGIKQGSARKPATLRDYIASRPPAAVQG